MAYPRPYNRQTNFQNFQRDNPSAPLPAAGIDAELNEVKLASDATQASLKRIQRSDGALANGIVTQDSFADSLSIGFTLRGQWALTTNYLIGDGVSYGAQFYRCLVANLSTSVNRPDVDATSWRLVADFTASTTAAQVAASAAAVSASQAASAAGTAATTALAGVFAGPPIAFAARPSFGGSNFATLADVASGSVYKGTYNAATNSPALTSGGGSPGDYFVVTTAGTVTADGVGAVNVGDQIRRGTTAYQRVPAFYPVGTGAGTLAAGNDSRIVGAAQASSLHPVATSGDYAALANRPSLGAAATSNSYLDLGNRPTLGTSAAKDVGTGAGQIAAADDGRIVGATQKSANLSDVANVATARANLGLGTSALQGLPSAGDLAAGTSSTTVPRTGDVKDVGVTTPNALTWSGGPALRSLRNRAGDRPDLRDYLGFDSTGANDCASLLVKAAVDSGANGYEIHVPSGVITLASKVFTGGFPMRFKGEGTVPVTTTNGAGANVRGPGTWFHLAHTDIGFHCIGQPGTTFRNIGTYRDQPVPSTTDANAPWSSANADYDFVFEGADIVFDDITLLNPDRGFKVQNGGARIWVNRVRGQAIRNMMDLTNCYDTNRVRHVHNWPFWSNDIRVAKYMLNNLQAFRIGRSDNASIGDLFSILHAIGLYLYSSTSGGASLPGGPAYKLLVDRLQSDVGCCAVYVDASVNGGEFTFPNLYAQGYQGDTTGIAVTDTPSYPGLVSVYGQNTRMALIAPHFTGARTSHVWTDNVPNNRVDVTAPLIGKFNVTGAGQAFVANGTSRGTILQERYETGYAGYGDVLGAGFSNITDVAHGGTGSSTAAGALSNLIGGAWSTYTPTASASGGTLGTYTSSGRYKIVGTLCFYQIRVVITSAGSSPYGFVNASLPVSSAGQNTEGSGRENAVTGYQLLAHIAAGDATVGIQKYDSSFIGLNGYQLDVSGVYEIAPR